MDETDGPGNTREKISVGAVCADFFVFAVLTSILAKMGMEKVDSHLATAIRTTVVLVMA